MRRQSWFEVHDQRWFPGFLRDLVTEALEGMWNSSRTYHPAVARLQAAVRRSGADRILDLCSGGGGPWPALYRDVAGGSALRVCLTDRYPNTRTLAGLTENMPGLTALQQPVDAQRVPRELRGFRTIFSSFHHFNPSQARAILADAFSQREGIAIFEAAQRSCWTLLAVTAVPLLSLRNAWRARPRRLARLFWTFVIPVVPAVLWIDGILSCLRSYSQDDLRELTQGLSSPDYEWEIGEERSGRVAIRYLIGTPLARCEGVKGTGKAHLRASGAPVAASHGQ